MRLSCSHLGLLYGRHKKMASRTICNAAFSLTDPFTDIVLRHYFQPGREDFRRALQSAMPKLLTNGQKSPKDEMKEILDGMAAKNWKQGKARLLVLLGKL